MYQGLEGFNRVQVLFKVIRVCQGSKFFTRAKVRAYTPQWALTDLAKPCYRGRNDC